MLNDLDECTTPGHILYSAHTKDGEKEEDADDDGNDNINNTNNP